MPAALAILVFSDNEIPRLTISFQYYRNRPVRLSFQQFYQIFLDKSQFLIYTYKIQWPESFSRPNFDYSGTGRNSLGQSQVRFKKSPSE